MKNEQKWTTIMNILLCKGKTICWWIIIVIKERDIHGEIRACSWEVRLSLKMSHCDFCYPIVNILAIVFHNKYSEVVSFVFKSILWSNAMMTTSINTSTISYESMSLPKLRKTLSNNVIGII